MGYEVQKSDGNTERFFEPSSQDVALRVEFRKGTLIIFEELLVVAASPHILAAYAPGTWNEVHWVSEEELT